MSYNGKRMIENIVESLMDLNIKPTVVVGYEAEKIMSALKFYQVDFVLHPDFQEGLGHSIAAGIQFLSTKKLSACFVCLGDMPLLGQKHIKTILDAYDEQKEYSIWTPYGMNRFGHPVLFSHVFFEKLACLTGDRGGEKILKDFKDEVFKIPVNDSAYFTDIDTDEDLRNI